MLKVHRLRSPRSLIAVLAAVVSIAAMLVATNYVKGAAHAAEELPNVRWHRFVFNAGGHDSCRYDGTVTAPAGLGSAGVVQAAKDLGADYEAASNGDIVFHSKWFECQGDSPTATPSAGGSAEELQLAGWSGPAKGAAVEVTPVGFAEVQAAGASLGVWIVGAVVGAVVAAVVAIYGSAAIIAAAAAVGVTLTAETAAIAAACLAGAVGGAIGETIKGNGGAKIATTAIVGCAGGAFIGKFRSLVAARNAMGQAAAAVAENGASATRSGAVSVATAAATELPVLASDANVVSSSAQNLATTVGDGLRRSASW